MQIKPAFFEAHEIRRIYDEKTEIWWFSVIDIIQVLTQQPNDQTARKYWNKLKYGNSLNDAVADMGKPKEIGQVFAGFQKYLYQRQAVAV